MKEKKQIDRKNIILNRKNHNDALENLNEITAIMKDKYGYTPDNTAVVCMALNSFLKSLKLDTQFER